VRIAPFTFLLSAALVASMARQIGGADLKVGPFQNPEGWFTRAALGVLRTEVGAAFAGGKLYVVAGGLAMAEGSTLVQEYDPKTNRWRERAPLPMPVSHVGVAALNGKVYAVGGFLKSVHLYAQPYAFEYDPAKNTWRTLPWMKVARGSVGVAVLGGKLHAIGGRGIDRVTVSTQTRPPTNGRTLHPCRRRATMHQRLPLTAGFTSSAADSTGLLTIRMFTRSTIQ